MFRASSRASSGAQQLQ